MTLLRLFTGVVFYTAVFDFTGYDVLATEMFSNSESESRSFRWTGSFLFKGAMSFSISSWFSANVFVKSDMISFLIDVFISPKFSGSTLRVLQGPATRFSGCLLSATEASNSPETNSATAFLFWLLVVVFRLDNRVLGKKWILGRNFRFFTMEKRNS